MATEFSCTKLSVNKQIYKIMNACPKLTFESDLKGLPTVMKSGESLNPRRPIFMPRINTMIEDGRLPAVLNMKKLFEFFA